MMKILQLNCVYRRGSTGNITADLHDYFCKNGYISYVMYERGPKCKEANIYKCAGEISSKLRNAFSRVTGNIYGTGKFGTMKIIRFIKQNKPDIVHIQCLNGFGVDLYTLLNWLKSNNMPTVITLHAEFMYTANCGYAFDCDQWLGDGCTHCSDCVAAINSRNRQATAKNFLKMKAAFEGFGQNLTLVGVSDWISKRAARSAILRGKEITTVFNGLDKRIFSFRQVQHPAVQQLHTLGKKVILHVTPYFEDSNKGGKYVLQLAEQMCDAPVHFLVAGNHKEEHSLPNVSFLGNTESKEELAALYGSADICLLTSRQETFSMVCAEALSCGTPVVGFCAGAPETIALKEYSIFVPYGNIKDLSAAMKKMLNTAVDKEKISQEAHAVYDRDRMAENYLTVYQNLLQRMNKDEQN